MAPRCTPVTQLSALFLLVSITISPLLAQDSEIISFAQEDLSALQASNIDLDIVQVVTKQPRELLPEAEVEVMPLKTAEEESHAQAITFSAKEREQLVAMLQSLVNEAKDKKTSKKLPEFTPSLVVSLGIRFPLFIWWCYEFAKFKEASSKSLGDAIGEGLKLSALTWLITEPFKDHTKPFYEYYRDRFDNYVNELFGYKKADAAVAA